MAEPIHVLHVDDDASFADVTAEFLEREDDRFVVETANSADEGIEHLASGEVDCVVSDFDMPGRNGIEFLDAIREDHPDLPFVLFTGKGSEEIASEAISAGVTDYLQKGGTDRYALLANRVANAVEQHRDRRAIERTQERFRLLVEEATDVFLVVDTAGTITYATPSAESILGRTPEELVGTSGFAPIHPEDRDRVVERFAELAEDPGRSRSVEFRYERPDGSTIWAEARGRNLVDTPPIEGIVVYTRDVTERKRLETDLEAVRDRMEFALDTTNSIIYEIDPGTGTETRHGPFERIYGIPESSVGSVEEFYEAAVHPEDRRALASEQADVIQGLVASAEVEYRTHPDAGEQRWIRSSMARMGEGADERVIGLATDVTHLKERETTLERQNERLEEFAGIVSHDLRTPLDVVRGRLTLARRSPETEHFEEMDRALDRMERLIDDMLTLARDDALGELEPVDLADLAESCWQFLRRGSTDLVTETDRRVRADPDRLRQLVENLLQNAVDHGGENVTVTVGDLEDGFYVADDGRGIPPERREEVFESEYTTAESGNGIGLSVVETVVEAHGWEVSVTESRDGGARFEVTGIDVEG